jgi:hypothetical protein
MHLHASLPSPKSKPLPPRIPPAAERIDDHKAARFSDVLNVADRPIGDIHESGQVAAKLTVTQHAEGIGATAS